MFLKGFCFAMKLTSYRNMYGQRARPHQLKFNNLQRWSRGHEAPSQAKDTKKFQGQGQTLSRPRPRTKGTGANVLQKKVFKKFFKQSQEKDLQKFCFRRFPFEENKKRSSKIFCEVSCAFQQNFNGSKNSAVLEPRTGQFSRT